MQYSDVTNDTGLIQDITFWTGADTNAYTLKDRTRNINSWYHRVVTMILRAQDEWDFDDVNHTDFPILTTDLVASQQDYSIPASEKVLKIKRLEVSYDGTNWYKAEPIDVNEIGTATDTTTIANNFVKTKPYYDLQNGSLFLYPIPDSNVTGGLKIWWTREIDEFTTADTTQEPGIDEPFHRMLSIGAAYDYAIKKGLQVSDRLKAELIEYEQRITQYYGSKQNDRQMNLKPAYVDYE